MRLSKFWVFAITVFLISCNKDDNPPISQVDIYECHNEIFWDSLTTNNALIGEWEWEYIKCNSNLKDGNDDEYKGLILEFKSDNTLDVKENGEVTQSSVWKVTSSDVNIYSINVTPFVNQLYGIILLCEDRVEFNHSILDGCDNYFKRK